MNEALNRGHESFETPQINLAATRRARRFVALVTYEDQKANLVLAYEKLGKDIFVATYKLVKSDAGTYQSHSV